MKETHMTKQPKCGFLILDRKGEYILDGVDQRGNDVFGLQHHPKASERMVVVSMRDLSSMKTQGQIFDYLRPQFSIKDIDPVDLADFLPGLTPQQADLIRDYAHIDDFYAKLLAETHFGWVDKSHWFEDFPGLFDLNDKGKKKVKEWEENAKQEGRNELTDEERAQLQEVAGGAKSGVLERAAGRIKRFCLNPFFGNSAKGLAVLRAPSCVDAILTYLSQGKFVFVDMRGQQDEDYTMVAALFARRLLNGNKARDDIDHIRACIVMEEAHNILSESELGKGNGRGSVFIELAREGRSFKLGFTLVTQQPDARSIAPEVVKTIDTVVAFNMPPDDAKHLQRLKSAYTGLDLEISNTPEFRGVAVSTGGPIFFQSGPIDPSYMQSCVDKSLAAVITQQVDAQPEIMPLREEAQELSLEERLSVLQRQRQKSIQPIALATLQAWGKRVTALEAEEVPLDDIPF